MKKHFDNIINFLSSIGVYFSATAIFPHIDNKDLLKSSINIDRLTGLLMLGFYVAFLGIGEIWKNIKLFAYWVVGITFLLGFLLSLFFLYYPFVNMKIVNVKFECGGIFLRGNSINYNLLDRNSGINYDSLAQVNPADFIQKTNCDPSIGWTKDSIEWNYKSIIMRYICSLFFFTCGIFSLIRAAFKTILP